MTMSRTYNLVHLINNIQRGFTYLLPSSSGSDARSIRLSRNTLKFFMLKTILDELNMIELVTRFNGDKLANRIHMEMLSMHVKCCLITCITNVRYTRSSWPTLDGTKFSA